jgi:hypothetical protein
MGADPDLLTAVYVTADDLLLRLRDRRRPSEASQTRTSSPSASPSEHGDTV